MKRMAFVVIAFVGVVAASLFAQEPRDENELADKAKSEIFRGVSRFPANRLQYDRQSDSLRAVADLLMLKPVRTRQDTVTYLSLRGQYQEWRRQANAEAQLDSLGVVPFKILVRAENPEWVHLDFPYSKVAGRRYSLICQAMRDLIALGAEPSYIDSTISRGQYTRKMIPGRLRMHATIALGYFDRVRSSGITPVVTYSDTTSNIDAKWYRFLRLCITDGRY